MYKFKFYNVIILSVLLNSCSGLLSEKPGVSYSAVAAQLGELPVYPPKQDFQVGDIFAIENVKGLKFGARRRYIERIDLSANIEKFCPLY